MLHELLNDMPSIFVGVQGNVCSSNSYATGYRDISPIISPDSKSSQPCIGNKPAVTKGSPNHPPEKTIRLNGRYMITPQDPGGLPFRPVAE